MFERDPESAETVVERAATVPESVLRSLIVVVRFVLVVFNAHESPCAKVLRVTNPPERVTIVVSSPDTIPESVVT